MSLKIYNIRHHTVCLGQFGGADKVQYMDYGMLNSAEMKMGMVQCLTRNPEKSGCTNTFWKISPSNDKVSMYGDIGGDINRIMLHKVR